MALNSEYNLMAAWPFFDSVDQNGVPYRIVVGIIDTLKELLAVSLSPLLESKNIPDRVKYQQISMLIDFHFRAIKENFFTAISIFLHVQFRVRWCEVNKGVLTDDA